MIFDATQEQEGDVEVHEYGNSTGDWLGSHRLLWLPPQTKKDQRSTTKKTKNSTALCHVIWSEAILFHAAEENILDEAGKLTKSILRKMKEFK